MDAQGVIRSLFGVPRALVGVVVAVLATHGTPIYAARAPVVTQAEESHFDGQVAPTGWPAIEQHYGVTRD